MDIFYDAFASISNAIQNPPGFIIGPISFVFGHIIDFIFRAVSVLTTANALGIAIIIMTVIVRTPLIPSQLKMQQNSRKSQLVKPEMDKIRAKYGNTRDPELRRKMSAEIQALNQKHGINMFASCLPMLVTMPIFIALFSVFGRAFLFIPSITETYTAVSDALIVMGEQWHLDHLSDIFRQYNILGNNTFSGVGGPSIGYFWSLNPDDLNRAIHVFTEYDWQSIFSSLQDTGIQYYEAVRTAYDAMRAQQSFFGLDLVTRSGLQWPGVIIPILSVGTMVYSSWQTQRMNPATDPQQKMMQRITMFILPIMFGWFTIQAASAVGLYWTAGNVFLIVQNIIVFKFFRHKIDPNVAKVEKKER